jgi:hypothetical protein
MLRRDVRLPAVQVPVEAHLCRTIESSRVDDPGCGLLHGPCKGSPCSIHAPYIIRQLLISATTVRNASSTPRRSSPLSNALAGAVEAYCLETRLSTDQVPVEAHHSLKSLRRRPDLDSGERMPAVATLCQASFLSMATALHQRIAHCCISGLQVTTKGALSSISEASDASTLVEIVELNTLGILKYKLSEAESNAHVGSKAFWGASTGTWVSFFGERGEYGQGVRARKVSFRRDQRCVGSGSRVSFHGDPSPWSCPQAAARRRASDGSLR